MTKKTIISCVLQKEIKNNKENTLVDCDRFLGFRYT